MKKIDFKQYYYMDIPSLTKKLNIRQLVLVSVPRPLKEFSCISVDNEQSDYIPGWGEIYELAIVNPLRNQFVLLNELDKKIIRKSCDYVCMNRYDPYVFDFKYPEIFVDNKHARGPIGSRSRFRLHLTCQQYKEGVEFAVLKQQNDLNIQKQFQELLIDIEKRKSIKPMLSVASEYHLGN